MEKTSRRWFIVGMVAFLGLTNVVQIVEAAQTVQSSDSMGGG